MHIPKIVFLISFTVFTLRHTHLNPSGKSLTGTDIELRLGIQMTEAIFCGFKVVKNKWICKW